MNTAQDVSCTVCNSASLKTTINFGMQPASNRFLIKEEDAQETYTLGLGSCENCGTAQLTHRIPFDVIRPRFEWLVYNEPEGHLDDVASELIKLPGVKKDSHLLGITYKDQSTLNRLEKLGYRFGKCIAEKDFNFSHPYFGLESIQEFLQNPELIKTIKNKYGASDIVLMRHVIEHSDNASRLINSLKTLLNPGGYLVMELPDSEKLFTASNHAFIWEEHISYFTENTLTNLAAQVGATISWFKRYPYSYEDSLLLALSFDQSKNKKTLSNITEMPNLVEEFAQTLHLSKTQWRNKLSEYIKKGKKIAVFGAGHLAAKFINFLDLKDLIDCVIDDNPNKADMLMPGSKLPIVPSSALKERGISICISTLSPESEIKVKQKLSDFFANGNQFISAFKIKEIST